MNQNQLDAIELILLGLSESEIAEKIGVSRQTINNWRNNEPDFIAELNLRREEIWSKSIDKFRQLSSQAIRIIADDLESEDEGIRRNAAYFILRQTNMKEFIEPKGDINAKKIARNKMLEDMY